MSVVAAAVVGSAVVGAGTAIYSANKQADAASDQIASSEKLADESLILQKELADQQRSDFAPWREAGESALSQLQSGINSGAFTVGDIDLTQDPGYQYRMSEGIEALDKSAAASGMLLSGAQQKGVTDYAQNVASDEYANAYAREYANKTNQYNMLAALSQQGQASAAGQASASSNLASSSSNILSGLSSTTNSALQNQANAYSAGASGVATSANQAAQNWLTYKNVGAY